MAKCTGYIGRAFIIDYFDSVEAKNVSQKLEKLGFEVKKDMIRIQSGSSCGYNAASIVTKMDFIHRSNESWWDASYRDRVYSVGHQNNENVRNMVQRANAFLGLEGKTTHWLTSTQVVVG